MCVMPAREDLETDMALELVKRYDKDGSRSIGVLTKVDLMNETSDLTCYLNNTMSADLKLKYGYYLLKNNSLVKPEKEEEMNFFKNKGIYLEYNSFLGIDNLIDKMNKIQMQCIYNKLPEISSFIKDKITFYQSKLDEIGELPNEKTRSKKFTEIINNIVTKFRKEINDTSGREIKDIFIQLRKELNELNPFESCSEEVLEDIIHDGHGNHMTMHLSIHILETVLTTDKINCFSHFYPIVDKYIEKIKSLVLSKLESIVGDIQGYTDFRNHLVSIINEVIKKYSMNTHSNIKEIIEMEKNYIWTDNLEFLKSLNNIQESKTNMLRSMATSYYKIIVQILCHNIPKIIMLQFISKTSSNLYTVLNNQEDLIEKLKPDKEVESCREKWTNCLNEINLQII